MNIQIVDDGPSVNTIPSVLQLIRTWQVIFPRTFKRNYPKPLKIGIHLDLQQQFTELTPQQIGAALKYYTRSLRYAQCLKEGTHRVDLAGEKIGVVTPEQAGYAKSWEKFLVKKYQSKGEAMSVAQPPPA